MTLLMMSVAFGGSKTTQAPATTQAPPTTQAPIITPRPATTQEPIITAEPVNMDGRAYASNGKLLLVNSEENVCSNWQSVANAEATSVASFARFTIDLMTLNAPIALIQMSQEFALDEIKHAKMALSLAGSSNVHTFGALPEHTIEFKPDLKAFVKDTFISGVAPELLAVAKAYAKLNSGKLKADELIFWEMVSKDEANHA